MVQKFSVADALFECSPGQDNDVYVANMVDERHGSPITVGYGRYAPNQELNLTLDVDDVMILLEGRLSVSSRTGTVTAGPGDIIRMPKDENVTIRSFDQSVVTAYVTYPHWREAAERAMSKTREMH